MNRIFKTLLTVSFCVQASTALAGLPAEVEAFLGKSGKHVSLFNGEETRDSGGSCKVVLSEYDSEGTTIVIDAPVMFKANASLDNTKKSIAGNGAVVFTTLDSGRRPGGSACGDFVPMTNYKKTVEIKDNALVIRQKFRCGFFEKNDLMSVCDLN